MRPSRRALAATEPNHWAGTHHFPCVINTSSYTRHSSLVINPEIFGIKLVKNATFIKAGFQECAYKYSVCVGERGGGLLNAWLHFPEAATEMKSFKIESQILPEIIACFMTLIGSLRHG